MNETSSSVKFYRCKSWHAVIISDMQSFDVIFITDIVRSSESLTWVMDLVQLIKLKVRCSISISEFFHIHYLCLCTDRLSCSITKFLCPFQSVIFSDFAVTSCLIPWTSCVYVPVINLRIQIVSLFDIVYNLICVPYGVCFTFRINRLLARTSFCITARNMS